MAIAFNATTAGGNTTTSPLAWNHTCSTGSSRLLIVGCNDASGDGVSGVTYNNVAMTQLVKKDDTAGGYAYIYGLLNPASGTNQISISFTNGHSVKADASSFTGVRQGSLPDATASVNGPNGQTISVNITTIADNCWIAAFAWQNTNGTAAAGSGYTLRSSYTPQDIIEDTNGAKTPAGTYAVSASWSGTVNNHKVLVAISMAPAQTLSRSLTDSIMNSVSRLATAAFAHSAPRSLSDSLMRAASRSTTISAAQVLIRALSASIMNSVSRLAVLTKGFFRSMSDGIMNARNRFTSISDVQALLRSVSASMMNAQSRLASVTKISNIFRVLSDSIMNAKNRLAAVSIKFGEKIFNVLVKAFSNDPNGKSKTIIPSGKSGPDKVNQ